MWCVYVVQLVGMCQDTDSDILERLLRHQRHAEAECLNQSQQHEPDIVGTAAQDRTSIPSSLPSSPPPSEALLMGTTPPTSQQVSITSLCRHLSLYIVHLRAIYRIFCVICNLSIPSLPFRLLSGPSRYRPWTSQRTSGASMTPNGSLSWMPSGPISRRTA